MKHTFLALPLLISLVAAEPAMAGGYVSSVVTMHPVNGYNALSMRVNCSIIRQNQSLIQQGDDLQNPLVWAVPVMNYAVNLITAVDICQHKLQQRTPGYIVRRPLLVNCYRPTPGIWYAAAPTPQPNHRFCDG